MPNVSLTLPETSQSIIRPIIFDMVGQVQEITKISKESKIFFPGDIQKMQTAGSDIGSEQNRYAMFGTGRYVFITVEEDYDINTLGSTSTTGRENAPVFTDEKLATVISPLYASSQVTINFKYRCFSKTEALKWRDDIRIRISQMRDINLHNLTYHYLLPAELLFVLKIIHEKREAFLGYGQTYAEYVTSMSTERLTLIGDLVNQDARLGVSETQCRVLGMYDFEGMPEKPERDDDTGTWTISFAYKFTYDKPFACNIRYPVMVHNQLLPAEYVYFTDKSYDIDKVSKDFSDSNQALNAFEYDSIMNSRIDPQAIIRLPSFDDYNIRTAPRGTGTVFLALCEIDTADSRTMLNLADIDPIVIDKDIMQFIQEVEYPFISKLYKSVINISLYRNNELTVGGSIICDSQLNVKAIADLDLRNQHRLRFSLVPDLTMLNREAFDRLRKYPKALVKIIGAMNEIIKNHPDFNDLGDKSYISNADFSSVYAAITGHGYDNGIGGSKGNYMDGGLQANNWPGSQTNFRPSGSFAYGGSRATRPIGNANRTPQVEGASSKYGSNASFNTFGRTIFSDIDPYVLENYRRNHIGLNAVMSTGVVAILTSK